MHLLGRELKPSRSTFVAFMEKRGNFLSIASGTIEKELLMLSIMLVVS